MSRLHLLADTAYLPAPLGETMLLPGRTGVAAPDAYLTCAEAPPDAFLRTAWEAIPSTAYRPGRSA